MKECQLGDSFGCGYAMFVINWQFVQRARSYLAGSDREMAAAAFSGPEIKQVLDETVKEMGLSSLKSKQTEAIYLRWWLANILLYHSPQGMASLHSNTCHS